MKQNILLVGDHPFSFSGNGHMMEELLRRIDYDKFNVSVFAATPGVIEDPFKEKPNFTIIEGGQGELDLFGANSLLGTLFGLKNINTVMFVGLDVWRYAHVWEKVLQAKQENKFNIIYLFPFDLINIQKDWVKLINSIDFPCVYSKYGYEMLKNHVPKLRYFRPPLYDSHKFKPLSPEERNKKRKSLFKFLPDDAFVYGFFGMNQIRKDPLKAIKALHELRKTHKNSYLYLHMEVNSGTYNINGFVEDLFDGEVCIFRKKEGMFANTEAMAASYNLVDCYLSTSMQEGLNWTILEAMLCGIPVIASDNTAHPELVHGAGLLIPCTEFAAIPMGGRTIETKACSVEAVVSRMWSMQMNKEKRNEYIEAGFKRANEWLDGVSDINELLEQTSSIRVSIAPKRKAVLFAQVSAAGDVLMSTQALPGIKERHKNLPLVYMTQKKYQDIVVDNPCVDEIIDWDEKEQRRYKYVYNPHQERILPGGFNNLDVTLSSMYAYFCKVSPTSPFISEKEPEWSKELPEKYVLIHSTGGDPVYRTYPHFEMVVSNIELPCIQIGGVMDLRVEGTIDLRDKMSFRETAWLMRRAAAAAVIDSFPAHLAGALYTPVIVLYGPAPARVTRPWGDPDRIINIEPNKLDACPNLTSCWDGRQNTCKTPCIFTINPGLITKVLIDLLHKFS